ncbi:hypothetical protein ACWC09_10905 [Streptomyces sp. NPDC001617]
MQDLLPTAPQKVCIAGADLFIALDDLEEVRGDLLARGRAIDLVELLRVQLRPGQLLSFTGQKGAQRGAGRAGAPTRGPFPDAYGKEFVFQGPQGGPGRRGGHAGPCRDRVLVRARVADQVFQCLPGEAAQAGACPQHI